MRVNQSNQQPVQNSEVSRSKESRKSQRTDQAEKSSEVSKKAATGSTDSVKADLSARGKEFAKAKAVASAAPDVREDKIAEIKRRIAEGKYQVDADKVADRMVDEHLKSGGA